MTQAGSDSPDTGDAAAQDFSSEHARLVFEQNFEQFRHLNDQMNRVPAFAVTLTGGFWYVAVVVSSYGRGLGPVGEQLARWAVMVFAGLCNVTLVFIAVRIRDVMDDYLVRIKRFEGEWWTERRRMRPWFRDYSMVSMYSILMLVAAALSFGGGFVLFWPSVAYSVWSGILSVVGALVTIILLAYWIPKWLTR